MKRVKSWVLGILLSVINIVGGYFITKLLDTFYQSEGSATITEISISSIHWSRYIPAFIIGVLASLVLFYLCKNLHATMLTKVLSYISTSIIVISTFVAGMWYKDPIYTLLLPKDDYYVAEKTNFLSSNGTIVVWSDKCTQSGRIVYCYVNLKNTSKLDQKVRVLTNSTYLITAEKAHVQVERYVKLGNQEKQIAWDHITAPKKMTIVYGLRFELPEPSSFNVVPNLRVGLEIGGYHDVFSISNRPLLNINGL